MREVLIDTESTGLDPSDGHRLIEVAGVEIFDGELLGASYHCYIQPEMQMDAGMIHVHGISNEFLSDKPMFKQIADGFLGFIDGTTLVAHNAPFDIKFLNAELTRIGYPILGREQRVIDTLPICKDLFPGQKNNLDSLLQRFDISQEGRDSMGALLDAELMAEIYIKLCQMPALEKTS